MRVSLAAGSAFVFFLFSCSLAAAQPPPSPLVLVVGDRAISIVDDSSYSVLGTVSHPPGELHFWWPAADGSRATLLFQPLMGKAPARVQVLDLVEHRALADFPLEFRIAPELPRRRRAGHRFRFATLDGKTIVSAFDQTKASTSLVAVDAAAGTIAGRQTLTYFPDELMIAAGSKRLLAVVAGETDADPADRTPGRIDFFDLPTLGSPTSLTLPGPIAAYFWNRDQTLLYALDQGVTSGKPERVRPRRVYVVDAATGTIVANRDLGPPSEAWDGNTIAVLPAPDHDRFYILEEEAIEILDGQVEHVLGMIALNHEEPIGLSFLLPPARALLHYSESSVVTAIDFEARQAPMDFVTGRSGVKFGFWALSMAGGGAALAETAARRGTSLSVLAPDGKTAFISNSLSFDLTVIDTETNQVLDKFGGSQPQVLADGHTVAVANGGEVILYDTATRKRLPPLPVEGGGALGVCPDGRHVWALPSAKTLGVYRIDLEQHTSESPIKGARGFVLFVAAAPKEQTPAPPPPAEPTPESHQGSSRARGAQSPVCPDAQ